MASIRPVTSDIKIKDFPRQFVWNPESDINFRKVMESLLITEQLKALHNSINTSQYIYIDYCLNKYNTIMHLAASLSLQLCKKKKTKRASSNKK